MNRKMTRRTLIQRGIQIPLGGAMALWLSACGEGSEETAVPPEDSPIQRLQGQLQALLLPRQQQLLLAAVESLPTAKPSGPLARWLPGRRAGGALAATSPRSTAIALASSLDNRHLVLVTGSEQMLDILTADQRQQLSARIVQIMAAYWQAQAAAVAGRIYQQLPATVLSVKRAATPPPVVQPEPTPPALKLPRFRRLGRRPLALNQAPTDRQPPALEMAPDAEVEVSPGSVTYIEHPLERVLRWLDRLLTWIERLYHRWFG